MALLFSKEILYAIDKELSIAQESVQIISAFCKITTIKSLIEKVDSEIKNKRIMIRFRKEDILKGSTDFEVLEYCLDKNWKVYVRFDLHAKTYIIDNKRGIVGSANVTQSGLTGNISNLEMASLIEIEEKDKKKIEKLFEEAIQIDKTIIKNLSEQLNEVGMNKGQSVQWNQEILDLFHPKIETLFSYELPEKSEYEENEYVQFLDLNNSSDRDIIKEKFRWCNAYLWLLNILERKNGEIYFGELSAELHKALVEEPKPYRKDVKLLLANLLKMIEKLGMDEVMIDRPNYSQRVYLKNVNRVR